MVSRSARDGEMQLLVGLQELICLQFCDERKQDPHGEVQAVQQSADSSPGSSNEQSTLSSETNFTSAYSECTPVHQYLSQTGPLQTTSRQSTDKHRLLKIKLKNRPDKMRGSARVSQRRTSNLSASDFGSTLNSHAIASTAQHPNCDRANGAAHRGAAGPDQLHDNLEERPLRTRLLSLIIDGNSIKDIESMLDHIKGIDTRTPGVQEAQSQTNTVNDNNLRSNILQILIQRNSMKDIETELCKVVG